MILDEWATRWGVPPEGLAELRATMGIEPAPPIHPQPEGSEAAAQQDIRLESSRRGERVWRNNVGATLDGRGNMIRYGLCNDSKAVNKVIKSHDLIGITPHTVDTRDIGRIIGVFTSYEVKSPGWKYRGTDREKAQLKWGKLIISLGGRAQFATKPGDIWR